MATRVAVVVSHPIQHFCPQYESWARLKGIELNVYFASRHGLDVYHDASFGTSIKWEGLTLDFAHEFLEGAKGRAVDRNIDSYEIEGRLSTWRPDLVVVYGYGQPLQRRVTAWAARNRRPVAMIGDSVLRGQRPWLKRVPKRLWLGRHLRNVDVFLTVGDANESYYRHFGISDRQFVRMCFPIDRDRFDQTLKDREIVRGRLRADLGIPPDNKIVLMVGKCLQSKRQHDLILFSNQLRAERNDVTVILAGSGPDAARLKADARRIGPGGVIFAGFVNLNELVDYYVAADVYAHCAAVEAHSLAISEAIYCGLPIVISDQCGSYGPTDDVRPGLNGLVYPCGSADGLSRSLLRLIDDGELRCNMGRESEAIGKANQILAHGKALAQAVCLLGST